MKLSSNIMFYSLLCISGILLVAIFLYIDYLATKQYIMECFTPTLSNQTSHTVNLPLTTSHSCSNFCGPTSRCAKTGHQCFTDIDCPGCQPPSKHSAHINDSIPGANDAGKLTVGVTPTFSPLTSGYGTREKTIAGKAHTPPPNANFGVDMWGNSFNETQQLFNRRYKTKQLHFMPSYPVQYSATGTFVSDGPLPSNY